MRVTNTAAFPTQGLPVLMLQIAVPVVGLMGFAWILPGVNGLPSAMDVRVSMN